MLFISIPDWSGPLLRCPASRVVEVLPLMNLKRVPGAPAGLAGVLNFHGTPVPVIDLNQMALGEPAARRLSTRIILSVVSLGAQPSHVRLD